MAHQSWKLRFAHLCFLGVLGVGCCPPAAIYVETTIHSDGSCDRMIWQPRDKFLPEQALKPEWNGSTLSAAEADELIQAIENHHRYENAIQEESKRIEERLQGDKQLNKRIKRDVLQMVGLYSFRFLLSGGAPEFEFAMRIHRRSHRNKWHGNQKRSDSVEIHWRPIIPERLRDESAEHRDRSRCPKEGPRASGFR